MNFSQIAALIALGTLFLGHAHAQQAKSEEPSLQETFEWMTNTLKPAEGNNVVTHRPFERPYPKDWVRKRIDPYHSEAISKFAHDG